MPAFLTCVTLQETSNCIQRAARPFEFGDSTSPAKSPLYVFGSCSELKPKMPEARKQKAKHRLGFEKATKLSIRLTRGEQCPQVARSFRRTKLAQSLGFNLANTLAGDVEFLADLFERMFPLAADAEAQPDHLLFLGR